MESEQEQCHEEDVGGQESLRIDDIISQRNEKETGGEEESDEGDYDEEEEEEDEEEEEEYDSESSNRKKSEKIAQERSRAFIYEFVIYCLKLQLLQNSLTKHHNIYKVPSPLKPTQSDIQILNQQSPLPNISNYASKDGVSRLSHPKSNKNQGGQVVIKSKEVIVSVLNTEEN